MIKPWQDKFLPQSQSLNSQVQTFWWRGEAGKDWGEKKERGQESGDDTDNVGGLVAIETVLGTVLAKVDDAFESMSGKTQMKDEFGDAKIERG
ncbi:hypothetical protein VNO80_15006 [Phaseolus coccineus]|uniref:Uncharacterized protein n=1 Tax=Phaseolus coccineus TaxID=3886 RepID=A0AAN9QYX1_PHACN